jgi:predicted GTPase
MQKISGEEMTIKTGGLKRVLATIIAALPEESREQVFKAIEHDLVYDRWSSHSRNEQEFCSMDTSEFQEFTKDVEKFASRIAGKS